MTKNQNNYWKENKNSNCLLLPRTGLNSRLDLFSKDIFGKKVLHIGCSDWPDTSDKLKAGTLLHQYLNKFASELYGLDISKEGIDIMAGSGAKNVFFGDIYYLHNNNNLLNKKFDILVVSEIIEHLLNPGIALDSIKKYIVATNPKCKIIFTVPNYHNFFFSFLSGIFCRETVHPDHKFYFSYRTFRNLIESCGFKVEDFYFATYGKGVKTLKEKILAKIFLPIFQCMLPHLYFRCSVRENKNNYGNE